MSKMYPLNPVIKQTLNGDTKLSIVRGMQKFIDSPQDQAFHSRNCFIASQSSKRAELKSYNRLKNKGKSTFRNKYPSFSTKQREIGQENAEKGMKSKILIIESKYFHTTNAQRLNLATVNPNPLRNDLTRDMMFYKETGS